MRAAYPGRRVGDPVLNGPFPGRFAFGALRCSDDNKNGDNIEVVAFPSRTHVYCFAYYVEPPPTSGTIIITKGVAQPSTATREFWFSGNISYTADQRFPLKVESGKPKSVTFYRAATDPADPSTVWTVREDLSATPSWSLTGLACSSRLGSVSTRNPARPEEVSISLLARDTVECTFTDTFTPKPGELLISKITRGDVGTFKFTVRDEDDRTVFSADATTKAPDIAVNVPGTPRALPAGELQRRRGAAGPTGSGRWRQVAAGRNAVLRPTARRRRANPPPIGPVQINPQTGQVCVFENRFIPNGAIAIEKITRGATGSTGFTITPLVDPELEMRKTATTTEPARPALARGDSTRNLRHGRYLIQEHVTVSDREGDWHLESVSCGPIGRRGRLRAFEQGRVVVELTEQSPRQVCRFVNGISSPPNPSPPPIPGPPDGETDLVVEKRALQSSVRFGQVAGFEITVSNAGPLAADDVVVADATGADGQLVTARASSGRCNESSPLICRIGTLAPGERVRVRVRVRAVGASPMRNVAIAGSGLLESRLSNNVDRARVRVRGASGVLGRCEAAAASRPLARAAC